MRGHLWLYLRLRNLFFLRVLFFHVVHFQLGVFHGEEKGSEKEEE
jgi:hypothetical protein